jgi:cullin 3
MLVETAPVPELTSTNDIDTGMGIEQVVEEDRKHLIEAAIVRVMKTRRQLDHNGLLIEVGKILNHRFTPSVQMIKSRIENLIDREFIAKDNDDVKLYYYVA